MPTVRSWISALTHVINLASDRRSSSAAGFAKRAARSRHSAEGSAWAGPRSETHRPSAGTMTQMLRRVLVRMHMFLMARPLAPVSRHGRMPCDTPCSAPPWCGDCGQLRRWRPPVQRAREPPSIRHTRTRRAPCLMPLPDWCRPRYLSSRDTVPTLPARRMLGRNPDPPSASQGPSVAPVPPRAGGTTQRQRAGGAATPQGRAGSTPHGPRPWRSGRRPGDSPAPRPGEPRPSIAPPWSPPFRGEERSHRDPAPLAPSANARPRGCRKFVWPSPLVALPATLVESTCHLQLQSRVCRRVGLSFGRRKKTVLPQRFSVPSLRPERLRLLSCVWDALRRPEE